MAIWDDIPVWNPQPWKLQWSKNSMEMRWGSQPNPAYETAWLNWPGDEDDHDIARG